MIDLQSLEKAGVQVNYVNVRVLEKIDYNELPIIEIVSEKDLKKLSDKVLLYFNDVNKFHAIYPQTGDIMSLKDIFMKWVESGRSPIKAKSRAEAIFKAIKFNRIGCKIAFHNAGGVNILTHNRLVSYGDGIEWI